LLNFGKGRASLVLADAASSPCDARVRGKLEALLNLLEGRTDSDMQFFSRDIEITGDTSVMVGLRNTLDREEINLLDDIATLCGPFAVPARRAIMLVNQAAERIKNRLADIH
jgi:predicted lipid carrier protein YhbT